MAQLDYSMILLSSRTSSEFIQIGTLVDNNLHSARSPPAPRNPGTGNCELISQNTLQIEAFPSSGGQIDCRDRSEGEVGHHLKLLEEAGFLAGIDVTPLVGDGPRVIPERLTWEGHEFLDSIRDDTVWKEVRGRLEKIGGQATIAVVKALAGSVAKNMLGLD